MTYIVATKPNGEKRWWREDEAIPPSHTARRPATAEEAALMDEVLRQNAAGHMPSDVLGEKLTALLAA